MSKSSYIDRDSHKNIMWNYLIREDTNESW